VSAETAYVPCRENAAYAKLQQGLGIVGGKAGGASGKASAPETQQWPSIVVGPAAAWQTLLQDSNCGSSWRQRHSIFHSLWCAARTTDVIGTQGLGFFTAVSPLDGGMSAMVNTPHGGFDVTLPGRGFQASAVSCTGSGGGISRGDADGTAIGWNPLGGSNSTAAGGDATIGSGVANANSTDVDAIASQITNGTANSTVLGDAGNQLIATSVTKVYSSDGVSPKGGSAAMLTLLHLIRPVELQNCCRQMSNEHTCVLCKMQLVWCSALTVVTEPAAACTVPSRCCSYVHTLVSGDAPDAVMFAPQARSQRTTPTSGVPRRPPRCGVPRPVS
jgi:hypothetical protein